jgi:4-hydroxybenzoate polyprenyltransferase
MDIEPPPSSPLGRIGARLVDYGRLIRLHQPTGLWLLGWPALWALWLAGDGHPPERVFVVFVSGVLLTRSAGCAINDFADRRFDPHVKRTRDRPLAAGRITPAEAILVYVVLSLAALALVLTLDQRTILYAVVGAALTVVYPFLKRIFALPQAWLGLAFTWSVPMAYAAERHDVPAVAWVLFAAGALWTLVYDTEYAMVDRDDDRQLPVKSTALLFGSADRAVIGLCQAGVVVLLAIVGGLSSRGIWYAIGLAAGGALFAYQQWLIRHREREGCFEAFRNNAWFGLMIFVGIGLDYLFTGP